MNMPKETIKQWARLINFDRAGASDFLVDAVWEEAMIAAQYTTSTAVMEAIRQSGMEVVRTEYGLRLQKREGGDD